MRFEAAVCYNETVIRRLTAMGYAIYHEATRQKSLTVSIVFLAAGFLWYSMTQSSIALVVLLLGCLIFTNVNAEARTQAKKILSTMNGSYPQISFKFAEDRFCAEFNGKSSWISYHSLEYIAKDSSFFYLFLSQNSVYAIDRRRFSVGTSDAFEAFLRQKTQMDWKTSGGSFRRAFLYSPPHSLLRKWRKQ